MDRLRCDVIVSTAFEGYFDRLVREGRAGNAGKIPAIDYVRCREGKNLGKTWWKIFWVTRARMPDFNVFTIAGHEVFLSPTSQKGLRNHVIDYVDGDVVVS